MSISPRTLADDLMLVVIGNDHILALANGINATLNHIKYMGGRVASHKNNIFSNSPKYAQWLAKKSWRAVQATIPVVTDLRDLGSHLHIASYGPATTIVHRFDDAINTTTKIRHLPHDYAKKAIFVRTCALTRALYGTEASPIPE